MSENNSPPNGEDKEPPPRKKPPKRETASSQYAGNNSSTNPASSTGTKQSNIRPQPQKLAGSSLVLLIVLVVVATHFYIKNGQPLFPLPATPPASLARQPNPANQADPTAKPSFLLLGEYGGKVYTYNQGTKKVYAYDWEHKTENQVCKLVEFDTFRWHKDGKLLVVSRRHNTQGGIYLLDLKQQNTKSEQVLITDREAEPYFPRNLSVESSLPLVWAVSGESFAFVARDTQDNTHSLFIFNLQNKQLIYTPARNFERIADLVWINGDNELTFIAVNDGGEKRYRVNHSGGDFRTWDAQP